MLIQFGHALTPTNHSRLGFEFIRSLKSCRPPSSADGADSAAGVVGSAELGGAMSFAGHGRRCYRGSTKAACGSRAMEELLRFVWPKSFEGQRSTRGRSSASWQLPAHEMVLMYCWKKLKSGGWVKLFESVILSRCFLRHSGTV